MATTIILKYRRLCAGSHTAVAHTTSTSLHRDVIVIIGSSGATVTASEFRYETFRRPALTHSGWPSKRRCLRWWGSGGVAPETCEFRVGARKAGGGTSAAGRRDVVGARAQVFLSILSFDVLGSFSSHVHRSVPFRSSAAIFRRFAFHSRPLSTSLFALHVFTLYHIDFVRVCRKL